MDAILNTLLKRNFTLSESWINYKLPAFHLIRLFKIININGIYRRCLAYYYAIKPKQILNKYKQR